MTERRTVVLVDERGQVQGEAPKLEAHQPPGRLHLAFSVLLFRPDGRLLLQRRAEAKYHFPGVWANACCSHPAPGEDLVASAERRLVEELGLACDLTEVGAFVYRARCGATGLVEHELDHVLVGTTTHEPSPDPDEVAEVRWELPGRVLDESFVEAAGGGRLAPWLVPAVALATGRPVGPDEAGLGGH